MDVVGTRHVASAGASRTQELKLFDVVALVEDLPAFNLIRGQVGTIVEIHREGAFEVEFVDIISGRTYALVPIAAEQLMVLHQTPVAEK